mmetsp:Transcript_697/g.1959  ORF Transcript_697/g.1959 Transcript_697/m.1959 type:complete len:464 (-) Transcript_697:500-1891(-)
MMLKKRSKAAGSDLPCTSKSTLKIAMAGLCVLAVVHWMTADRTLMVSTSSKAVAVRHNILLADETALHCEWNHGEPLDGCYQIISHRLAQRNIAMSRPWLFLGDETMSDMYAEMIKMLKTKQNGHKMPHHDALSDRINGLTSWDGLRVNVQRLKSSKDRCAMMEFMALAAEKGTMRWVSPSLSLGEGPVHYGFHHEYCTECEECRSQLHHIEFNEKGEEHPEKGRLSASKKKKKKKKKTGASTNNNLVFVTNMRYMVVEFARDVSQQTLTTKTTQETVANYIADQRKQEWQREQQVVALRPGRTTDTGSICVISAGLQDLEISQMTKELYTNNVEQYWRLLLAPLESMTAGGDVMMKDPVCAHIIWISIPAVIQEETADNNAKAKEWNDEVFYRLAQPNGSTAPDLSIASTRSLFRDRVTYVDVWNRSLELPALENGKLSSDEYHEPMAELFADLFATKLHAP